MIDTIQVYKYAATYAREEESLNARVAVAAQNTLCGFVALWIDGKIKQGRNYTLDKWQKDIFAILKVTNIKTDVRKSAIYNKINAFKYIISVDAHKLALVTADSSFEVMQKVVESVVHQYASLNDILRRCKDAKSTINKPLQDAGNKAEEATATATATESDAESTSTTTTATATATTTDFDADFEKLLNCIKSLDDITKQQKAVDILQKVADALNLELNLDTSDLQKVA